ncbi:MAG: hypothetical protein K2W95_16170 [Candidatus Obscuribacterales bacterium]|nr:hypothetical protein [Candidatus Obscuribacterales bacterium]
MYKADESAKSTAKQNILLFVAIMLIACAFFAWTHMAKYGKKGYIGLGENAAFVEMAFPQLQAKQYLSAAELLEKENKYCDAEYHYRRYAEIAQQIYPDANFNGVIGRILDVQGRHAEADAHYTKFEQFVTLQHQRELETSSDKSKKDEMIGRSVVANGRLLSILQTVPYEQANEKFAYGKVILKESNLPAGELGMRASLVKLGKQIAVFTEPSGDTASSITVPANTLRKLLAKTDRNIALREFTFAKQYYPSNKDGTLNPEEFSNQRITGYGTIASPRDLVPVDMAVIALTDFTKLRRLAGGTSKTNDTPPVAITRRYHPARRLVEQSPRRRAQTMPPPAPSRMMAARQPYPGASQNQYQYRESRSAFEQEPPKSKRFLGLLGKCLKAPLKVAGSLVSAVKRELR